MVTMVGMQKDYTDALIDLMELEYDAIEAYRAAINRLENQEYKSRLEDFCKDYEDHIKQLKVIIESHHQKAPTQSDMKDLLTQGKVVIAALVSDKAILTAMLTNENDTNTAYDRLNKYPSIPHDDKLFLDKAFNDEKEHKAWIEQTLEYA